MSDTADRLFDETRYLRRPAPQSEAAPRDALVPFGPLWFRVVYKRWEDEDHFADPLIVQLDLYADEACTKLLVDGLWLADFTDDQALLIKQNLDVVLFCARVRR